MWQLKTVPKGYLMTPGILPKVEISVHYNQGDFKLKNENKIQKHKGLTRPVLLSGQQKYIMIKFAP